MEPCIVRTKEELKAATDAKMDRIIVRGELAETLNSALKIKTASKWSIGILAVALAAIPVTGGVSLSVLIPIAALSGIEIIIIIAIIVIGIILFWAIYKGYGKVTFKGKTGDVEAELVLER